MFHLIELQWEILNIKTVLHHPAYDIHRSILYVSFKEREREKRLHIFLKSLMNHVFVALGIASIAYGGRVSDAVTEGTHSLSFLFFRFLILLSCLFSFLFSLSCDSFLI